MKSENRFKRPRRSGRTLSLLLTAVMIISSGIFSMQAQAAGQSESAGQDKAAVEAYAENESLFQTADISPADRPHAAWTDLRKGFNMKDAARKVSGSKEARPTGGLAESRILRIKDDPAAEVHDDA
ncbi:MAG: hypothetical protein II627_01065, partial [Lachnospiraceae bacterium]|nr:hypothetical protein [Lachnospiraceae bacterium]